MVVNNILETFYYFSWEKVNRSKFQVLFSPNIPGVVVEAICGTVGFNHVEDVGTYLGLSLLYNRVTVNTFDFVVNKVRQKLSSWQVRKLSMSDRITLVWSVLFTISNYFIHTV